MEDVQIPKGMIIETVLHCPICNKFVIPEHKHKTVEYVKEKDVVFILNECYIDKEAIWGKIKEIDKKIHQINHESNNHNIINQAKKTNLEVKKEVLKKIID